MIVGTRKSSQFTLVTRQADMSSAAFSETLQFVTNVKLQELEKRRQAFGQHASKVLAEAQKHDHDLIQKVLILVEGITSWPGLRTSDGNLKLNNIQRWLNQVRSPIPSRTRVPRLSSLGKA